MTVTAETNAKLTALRHVDQFFATRQQHDLGGVSNSCGIPKDHWGHLKELGPTKAHDPQSFLGLHIFVSSIGSIAVRRGRCTNIRLKR